MDAPVKIRNLPQVLVRLPHSTYEQLKTLAEEKRRSMSAQACVLIETAIRKQPNAQMGEK